MDKRWPVVRMFGRAGQQQNSKGLAMNKDPAWALAEHICGSGFADLPTATRRATCNDILDTFGCLLGGSGEPGIAELARVTGGWGGAQQSQVMLAVAASAAGAPGRAA
jgi:hypothetical protein